MLTQHDHPGVRGQRNLAFTIEISTPVPAGTQPSPPSYVHRPPFTHELILWALTYRQHGMAAHTRKMSRTDGERSPARRPLTDYVEPELLSDVMIRAAGSCTAAKAKGELLPNLLSQAK